MADHNVDSYYSPTPQPDNQNQTPGVYRPMPLHGGQPPQAPTFQPPHYGAPAYQPAGPGVPISSPRLPTCSLRFPTSPHSGVFPSHSGVFTSHSGVFTPIVVVSAPVAGPPYPDTELAPDIKLPAAICSATLSGFIASGTSLWCTCSGASDVFTGPSHKYTVYQQRLEPPGGRAGRTGCPSPPRSPVQITTVARGTGIFTATTAASQGLPQALCDKDWNPRRQYADVMATAARN
ncbi:hypothetical protein ACJQWK_04657 [Exserohilum turcicum]